MNPDRSARPEPNAQLVHTEQEAPDAQPSVMADAWARIQLTSHEFVRDLQGFPWRTTAHKLQERFRDDQLGLTASSLTFTTLISLVPLFTVGLAIFSALPMFAQMQVQLQGWLVQSLMPESISRQVLKYLAQFSSKASRLGWASGLFLLVSSLALMFTFDNKINAIWRVQKNRRWLYRLLLYWAVLTLLPLLLAVGLNVSIWLDGVGWGSASKGVEFVFFWLGLFGVYRYLPAVRVNTAHALIGGLFSAVALGAAKSILTWYLTQVPTYSAIYGAFATLPILLIWMYVAWVLVLLGAVITAYLPSLLTGIARRGQSAGFDFQLTLEVLAALRDAQSTPVRGLGLSHLAQRLRVDPLALQPVVQTLIDLGWVGVLDDRHARHVLLVHPPTEPAAPLLASALLAHKSSSAALWALWQQAGWTLADCLPPIQTASKN